MRELVNSADKYAKASGNKTINIADQFTFLTSAATIAVHNGNVKTLKKLIPRITPLLKENLAAAGKAETQLFAQADFLTGMA